MAPLCFLSQVLPAVAKLILVHFHWQVSQILDRYVASAFLPTFCVFSVTLEDFFTTNKSNVCQSSQDIKVDLKMQWNVHKNTRLFVTITFFLHVYLCKV